MRMQVLLVVELEVEDEESAGAEITEALDALRKAVQSGSIGITLYQATGETMERFGAHAALMPPRPIPRQDHSPAPNAQPAIAVYLDGGLVSDVQSDIPVTVFVLDRDVEGADEEDLILGTTITCWTSDEIGKIDAETTERIRKFGERSRADDTALVHQTLDGPLFRRQREFLIRLLELLRSGQPHVPQPEDQKLLEGLIELTDALADQAHDLYGTDCLLQQAADDDSRCDCEDCGYYCSGVPGILAHVVDGKLAAGAMVERCDQCQRYPSDAAAYNRLVELGIAPPA